MNVVFYSMGAIHIRDFLPMSPYWTCLLSHDLTVLANLFFERSQSFSCVSKQIVFSHGRALSMWLDLYLARRHGLSWGLDHQCLHSLFPKLYPLYVSLQREELFWNFAEEMKGNNSTHLSASSRTSLYSKLEQLFRRFGEMHSCQRQKVWQKYHAALWKTFSLEGKMRRDHLVRWREVDPEASLARDLLGSRVDIFGVDWLSPLQLEMIQWLSHSIEITLYVFSPSSSFWGEDMSRQRKHTFMRGLLRTGASDQAFEEAEQTLDNSHPLLIACGSLARTFLHSLEDYGALVKGAYSHSARQSYFCQSIFSEDVIWGSREPTLLERVKEGLLLCPVHNSSVKKAFLHADHTLKIHCAPDPLEQVRLAQLEVKRALSEGFSPEEIVVLVPDMHRFEPLIASVFSDRSLLDVETRIWSTTIDSSHLLHRISRWMMLMLSQWGKEDVLDFLSFHDWGERFDFDRTAWKNFFSLFEKQPYFWGYDESHQNIFLHHPESKKGKTWHEVSSSVVLSLLFFPHHPHLIKFPPSFPSVATPCLPIRDFMQFYGCLNNCLGWLEKSATLLAPFLYRKQKTPSAWIDLLLQAIDCFPLLDEEEEIFLFWKQFILEKKFLWSHVTVTVDPDLFWERFYRESCTLFEGWKGCEAVDVLSFAPLLTMKTIPHRLIILMGLDESSFPRSDTAEWVCSPSLNQYHPSSIFIDRYAFLESICSAQDRLILLYSPSKESQAKEDLHSSSVVEEFLSFLEEEGVDTKLRSCGQSLHQLHTIREQKTINRLSENGHKGWMNVIPRLNTLTLQECRSFLKNPANFFLTHLLGEKYFKATDPFKFCSKQFFSSKILQPQDEKKAQDWIYSTWSPSFAAFEERMMLSQMRPLDNQVACSLACLIPEQVDIQNYLFPAISIDKNWITGFFSFDLPIDQKGMRLPQSLLSSIRSFLPYLADVLAFRLLPSSFGFERNIRLESGQSCDFTEEEALQILRLLFFLCVQGSTCLLPWPILSRSRHEYLWSKSLATTPHAWLIKQLEDSLSPNQKEQLFEQGWSHLIIPFEQKVQNLFFRLLGGTD